MLPPAAFTDPGVLDWELENDLLAAGSASGTSRRSIEPGPLPDARDRRRQRGRDRRRGRPPARLPQRLQAPRARACSPRPRARSGAGCAAPTTHGPTDSTAACRPRRTWTGSRTSTTPATACSRCASRAIGGPAADRPQRRGPRSGRARRRPRRAPRAIPQRGAAQRRAHRLRRRRELEGDRRELQRVPALPRRPSRS